VIFSATIVRAGETEGTWIITPAYTRVDGQPAPNITALAANNLSFTANDIVLCAESINGFEHESVRSFDNNRGANPVIIATFAELITTLYDVIVKGKMTLGEGTEPMVLGNSLAAWAATVDTALGIIQAAAGSDTVPAITASSWSSDSLSQNHKLD
jgi:hypothetical protein